MLGLMWYVNLNPKPYAKEWNGRIQLQELSEDPCAVRMRNRKREIQSD